MVHIMHQLSISSKKIPSSVILLAACVFGMAVGLFGLNLWHTSRCSGEHRSSEQVDEYISVLERRILEAESQVCEAGYMSDEAWLNWH